MGFFNLVLFQGYLPTPSQIRYFPDGSPLCEFLLVLEESGDYLRLDVSFPGPEGIRLAPHLKPQTFVFVEGRFINQKPRPERGIFHPYRIVASRVILLGSVPISGTIKKAKN